MLIFKNWNTTYKNKTIITVIVCHKIVCRFLYNQKTWNKSFFSFSYRCERQTRKKAEEEEEEKDLEYYESETYKNTHTHRIE